MGAVPSASWRRASEVTSPIRSVKDADEIERLRAAGAAVDRIATRLQRGEIELVGRTEAEVSAELGRQIVAEGHDRTNFAIVAAGADAASPHHEPGGHVISDGEVVLCDFGGHDGRRRRRRLLLGHNPLRVHRRAARRVQRALRRAVRRAGGGGGRRRGGNGRAGRGPGRPVDHRRRRLRRVLHSPHRPRHRHRGPRGPLHRGGKPRASGGRQRLLGGAGDLRPRPLGARLEDIVAASPDGADPLNCADHRLAVVA